MAVVTYQSPVAGLTAPTAAQMSKLNTVVADVAIELYDTTFTVTHNMAISAADLADGYPRVKLTFESVSAIQEKPFIASKSTNAVVFTVTDFGISTITAPVQVTIERPASFTQ